MKNKLCYILSKLIYYVYFAEVDIIKYATRRFYSNPVREGLISNGSRGQRYCCS